MLIVDGYGSVRTCGESLARLLGRGVEELAGMPVWALLPAWSPFETAARMECRLRQPVPRASLPVSVSCEAVHVPNDTLFLLDVRPHRGAAQALPAEAVMVTDRRGEFLHVNTAFEKMTGYARAELVGRTPAILNSGLHPERAYRDLWDTLLDGRVYRGALVNRRKNGELYHEHKVIRPVPDGDGRPVLFLCSGRELAVPGLRNHGAPQRPWMAL
jgi:PAS domain S-box-containing protein